MMLFCMVGSESGECFYRSADHTKVMNSPRHFPTFISISCQKPLRTDNNNLMLIVSSRIRVPMDELQFTYARSQGPGGQNVNKVNTKATLRWSVIANQSLPDDVRSRFLTRYKHRITKDGDLLITSQRYRDRGRNVDDCLDKLRELISAVVAPPKKRRATKPTKGSKARRRKTKEATAQKKERRKPPKLDD